ncbi:helix-turn-helix domain-containing protein [Paenibacillus chungangensis]|uniref:Helix-turn-helix domain-containing protein n=1 Tax=Paenibacillus chungangensis TaxID=696535 RepID=A0ABW3HV01_9BACL
MKLLKSNKLFLKLYLSYAIMFIVPLAIVGVLVYGTVLATLEEETRDYGMATLQGTSEVMDMRIRELDDQAYQLSQNRNIASFMNNEMNEGPLKIWEMKEIVQDLSLYQVPNNLLDTSGVFFFKNNIVLTQNSSYETNYFYRYISRYRDMPYEQWLEKLRSLKGRELWPSAVIDNENSVPRRYITYLRSLPLERSEHLAVFFALIDEEMIWSLLGKSELAQNSYLGIVDSKGEMIISPKQEQSAPQISYEDVLKAEDGYYSFREGKERYTVMHASSDVVDWTYFFITPEKVLLNKISSVRAIFVAVMLICLLAGIALSYFLSKRSYTPLQNIVRFIRRNRADAKDGEVEYETIFNTIRDAFTENKELEQKFNSQLPNLKTHFLQRLLKQQHPGGVQSERELADLYGLRFPYRSYHVAAVNMDDFGKFSSHTRDKAFARFAVSNIAEELLSSLGNAYAVELEEGMLALIVNTEHSDIDEEHSREQPLWKKLQSYCREQLGMTISIGIGRGCGELTHIGGSFNEAVSALHYGLIRKSGGITHYAHIGEHVNTIYYPMDKERQLMNCVKAGDGANALRLLDEIYRLNIVERQLPVAMVNCLVYSLMSTTFNILDELHLDYTDYFDQDMSKWMDKGQAEDSQARFKYIATTLERICGTVVERKADSGKTLHEDVLEHIHRHYANEGLSLSLVAEQFRISPTYLSRMFKEGTGYTFADYINRYRISQGKQLLKEGTMSISEVAEASGFMSANTFIRVFKKYESVTPGQYKESHAGSAQS